jgi:hypothetical protein
MKYFKVSLLFSIILCTTGFADNIASGLSTAAALKKYALLLKNKSY